MGPISFQTIALIIVALAALWLFGVGVLMALRPRYCLHIVEKMKVNLERSNWRLQFTEQGLRVVVGGALILRGPSSKFPLVFEIGGWVLVATSLLIMAAPIRWHGRYGSWLLKWLTPRLIRILCPAPIAAGTGLIFAAL